MRRARRRGLAHEAADRIRESILQGSPPPGAPLREVDLATRLDVSRGSVREGLALLEQEGLVVSQWHRGARVIEPTPTEVDEVYTVRGALERLAAHRAATRATDSHLAELAGLVHALEHALARGADAPELLRLDLGFHDRLYELADNTRLQRAWQAVRSPVHLFQLTRIRLGHPHYREVVVDEHRALTDLLIRREAEAAARHAEAHVASARDALMRMLRSRPPATDDQ
ncbi:GntR family transcriptional regulator [Nocardiopsis sp. N85]|uniref:GntR family transcriptional regulator n=1 Tax=Nocardiopsis sp. N85 TaxID=3029400 RepID=UPI00237F703D|nr:GntR family transcriptional regulator [Nocardiopsis sp. N85]MDE3722238.1 GntR family transcriptional regulator [Nocardiopsis sp. N85]